ncbi:hypothetical protein YC2023_118169 [Brassica napus]
MVAASYRVADEVYRGWRCLGCELDGYRIVSDWSRVKNRKLITSTKLYKRRSQLGITEYRVYALLCNRNTGDCRFYILHQKVNCSNRLVIVRSLPPISYSGSFVPVGSKTYVFNDL